MARAAGLRPATQARREPGLATVTGAGTRRRMPPAAAASGPGAAAALLRPYCGRGRGVRGPPAEGTVSCVASESGRSAAGRVAGPARAGGARWPRPAPRHGPPADCGRRSHWHGQRPPLRSRLRPRCALSWSRRRGVGGAPGGTGSSWFSTTSSTRPSATARARVRRRDRQSPSGRGGSCPPPAWTLGQDSGAFTSRLAAKLARRPGGAPSPRGRP
jgi:hypothetical protein